MTSRSSSERSSRSALASISFRSCSWPQAHPQETNNVTGAMFAGRRHLVRGAPRIVQRSIIVMWENLNTARAATYNEADQLANVYWVEHSLPLPGGAAIDALSLDYAHTVIETEWPLMAKRGESSTDATHIDQQIPLAVPSSNWCPGLASSRGAINRQ